MPDSIRKGESKDAYISRCMSSEEMMKEFPRNEQRFAVCLSKWESRNKKKESTSDENKDIVK